MSKIGKLPVEITQGANVTLVDREVKVKGPKGELTVAIPKGIKVNIADNKVNVERENDSILSKSFHGTVRTLIANAVHGVTKGWEKRVEVVGTGYGVSIKNGEAVLKVGYSHLVTVPKRDGVTYSVDGQTILVISSANKELIGQIAHQVRSIKPPDPYKGKGIRYAGEHIKLKPGKKAKTA
ncbi:MAG: 50S ribosomal protein L6 [Patescibacteria group bacterium]